MGEVACPEHAVAIAYSQIHEFSHTPLPLRLVPQGKGILFPNHSASSLVAAIRYTDTC